jgi:uncharacterized protein
MATLAPLPHFLTNRPLVIAALHLPAFSASRHPDAIPMPNLIEYALRNVARAVKAGISTIYVQDIGDYPIAPSIQPYTIAGLAVVCAAIRRDFPHLALGVCTMSHGAREPLAIAQSVGAQFIRLKVYVGVMVKEGGILEGCAYEAIQYRSQINADSIAILADVYDRTGIPMGRMSLTDEARQAAVFGRADSLILTGSTFSESLEMLGEVRRSGLSVPLLLGGGANPQNVAEALKTADGVIVSSAFKTISGWSRQSLMAEWDGDRIQIFMNAVNRPTS